MIRANHDTVWQGLVEQESLLDLEFATLDHNTITIALDNKINGPDTWDTVVNQHGQIVQDKYCRICAVMIDGMRCPWLIEESLFRFDQSAPEHLHGWLSQNGHYQWSVPADVRNWILQNRKRRSMVGSRTSSLHYHQNYFNTTETEKILPLIEQCRHELTALHERPGN